MSCPRAVRRAGSKTEAGPNHSAFLTQHQGVYLHLLRSVGGQGTRGSQRVTQFSPRRETPALAQLRGSGARARRQWFHSFCSGCGRPGPFSPLCSLGFLYVQMRSTHRARKGSTTAPAGPFLPPVSSSPRAASRHSFGWVFKNLPPGFEIMAMSLFTHFHDRIRGFRSFVLPTFVFHLLSQMISPKLSVNSTLSVYVTLRQNSSLRRRAVYSDGISSL